MPSSICCLATISWETVPVHQGCDPAVPVPLWLSFWSQGGLAGVGRPGAFHPTMAAQAFGHTAES